MRINNKRVGSGIKILYGICIVMFVLGLFLYFIPIGAITDKIPAHYFFILSTLIILIIRFFGNQLFEYDSDGEALNFKSQDAFLVNYSRSFMKSSDFPKKKLISFKIKGFPRKTLELFITSKRSSSGTSKLKYNITYLNSSEIKDLKRSLKKVVDENKTRQHVEMMENDNV